MEFKYKDIILRDYRIKDIEDEIRWMTTETSWMKADTPWEQIETVNPAELREDRMGMLSSMQQAPKNVARWRLEIEFEHQHIGFVSSYYLTESYDPADWEKIDWNKSTAENHVIRALGIEICESAYWSKGLGTKALAGFIRYYNEYFGETRFALETWSGNYRMVKCAEKLDFSVVKREVGIRNVAGVRYDAMVYEKKL